MNISATEIQTFKQCRRLWNYTSLNKQSLQPRRPATALSLGIGIHEALEAYYGRGEDPIAFFEAWALHEAKELYSLNLNQEAMDDLQSAWDLGRGMMQHYREWAQLHDDFVMTCAEQEFKVPIADPTTGVAVGHFVGRFDGIARSNDGKYWVVDHKSFSVKPRSADWLQLNEQFTMYTYAANVLAQEGCLEQFGLPPGGIVHGVLYNGIRKKLPTVPAVLKSGELSRAGNIDTTYEVYLSAVRSAGLDPADYDDILERLKCKENSFFVREYVPRGREELLALQQDLFRLHQEMANPNAFLYHSPTTDCLWKCDFRQPCIARNVGGDESLQLRTHYIPRASKGEVYETD